jgi:hypothetical protein
VNSDIRLGNNCDELSDELMIPGKLFISKNETDCETELRFVNTKDRTFGGGMVNKLYPIPAMDELNLRMILDEGQIDISISDMLGEKTSLLSESVSSFGIYLYTLDVSAFPAGSYILEIRNDDKLQRFPITIQ